MKHAWLMLIKFVKFKISYQLVDKQQRFKQLKVKVTRVSHMTTQSILKITWLIDYRYLTISTVLFMTNRLQCIIVYNT